MSSSNISKRDKPAPEEQRDLIIGRTETGWGDNSVKTSKYNLITFFPLAIGEQFRKYGNVYFLVMGSLMALGVYGGFFESAVSPWTTLGPLAIVISVSLGQQGAADLKRHRNDAVTNAAPCIVLRQVLDNSGDNNDQLDRHKEIFKGHDLTVDTSVIACANVARQDIKAGDIVLVRNREMIPADIVLLGSSSENGSAYIETSPIDGETNLKLRTKPTAPEEELLTKARASIIVHDSGNNSSNTPANVESLEQAVKRIVRYSNYQSHSAPLVPASLHPHNANPPSNPNTFDPTKSRSRLGNFLMSKKNVVEQQQQQQNSSSMLAAAQSPEDVVPYVATLTSEAPNASVNTFSGKLTLPPPTQQSPSIEIPLDADNILLRGAFLRNTDWVLGVACFTGKDTKLVMNSFATPSKFSQLDLYVNATVLRILCLFAIIVLVLGGLAVSTHSRNFSNLWYAGYNSQSQQKWPYLPTSLDAPDWSTTAPNYIQFVLTYITLLTNFVPLSLYVSVEITAAFLMYLIYVDVDMYHPRTDTAAAARNTNITDLGQVQYVFSDKTGTLTQNVMVFKRCSVDGHIYGKPVAKSAPTDNTNNNNMEEEDDEFGNSPYQELPQLLGNSQTSQKLSFNGEMFLRIMSICHTVVVEKEFSGTIEEDEPEDDDKSSTSGVKGLFSPRNRKKKNDTSKHSSPEKEPSSSSTEQGLDGAPRGFAYQAESPDEGALVSAAALEYQFQLLGRDSNGVQLACTSPSILQDSNVVSGLQSGRLDTKQLAARSSTSDTSNTTTNTNNTEVRQETWQVLAINKFDSTRKRMSVLVRSPPELGNLPILFCKGADSSMLDPSICQGGGAILSGDEASLPDTSNNDAAAGQQHLNRVMEEGDSFEVEPDDDDVLPIVQINTNNSNSNDQDEEDDFEQATLLAIQSHLGTFASEGLRTLVLGLRILTEDQCDTWLAQYKAAATSMMDRDAMLKQCARDIECEMHIVGATAIEDKLQRGVPETISKLEQSGIKLWVLTGDKRETAIEIGYSTKVLTPKMHVTEVADAPSMQVKTLLAMEFIRLVKMGKLDQYQKAAFVQQGTSSFFANCRQSISNGMASCMRSMKRFYITHIRTLCGCVNANSSQTMLDKMDAEDVILARRKDPIQRHKTVRQLAEDLITQFRNSPEGKDQHELYLKRKQQQQAQQQAHSKYGFDMEDATDDENTSMASDSVPTVFARARSAALLMTINSPTASNMSLINTPCLVDEDVLSEQSFRPESGQLTNHYNPKKNHFLERTFAVDREVRNGRLYKHLTPERRAYFDDHPIDEEAPAAAAAVTNSVDVQRALVIEGAALLHLLGDDLLEELFFAVASQCDSVIACRVSPKQKALLVKLVRNYVLPEPVTLAIGDGANDVGMIQEAHIGVGISGLEGQQAVNASDFSIAQFRFLEDLLLVHGRWNFSRMSRVILFSFYKNAVLACILILYNFQNHFSGTPVFDQWVLSMFNFVAFFPILFLGLFDRDLNKDYVKRNPQTYAPGPNNEYITNRTILRWISLVLIHALIIFYGTMPSVTHQGGMNSAFTGLMKGKNKDRPGDGEGSDIKVFGTLIYSILIVVLIYKVLFECRSLIHGKFPLCTCRNNVGEGFWSRLAYTWQGATSGSFLFLLAFLYVYELLAKQLSMFSPFIAVTTHMFNHRAVSWLLMIVVPIAACAIDVAIKVFSNMFYPTQIQIHAEIQAAEIANYRRHRSK